VFIEEYLQDLRRDRFSFPAQALYVRRVAGRVRENMVANPGAVRSVWSVALLYFTLAFAAAVALALADDRSLAKDFFLATALGQQHLAIDRLADVQAFTAGHAGTLQAISLGAVFFGAMTYIGNGPNFMVKAIAEHAKVRAPTFLGYIVRFALPVLLPVLAIVGILFFSRWRIFG